MGLKNFHVYKSSAGSGKTYTLVKEYLKLVLREPGAMPHILAITFTNAAAAEMKQRIIEALGRIAALRDHPEEKKGSLLVKQILSDWRQADHSLNIQEEQVIRNAGMVLKKVLHQYADFSVSTIDSFVHRVIRTFAFDLHIPVNFEVELDTRAMLNKAVDMLINRAGNDRQLTDLLVTYMISQADEEKDVRIEQQIARMAETLMDEDSGKHIEQLREISLENFQHIAGNLKKSVRQFEDQVRKEARDALRIIEQQNLEADHFFQSTKGIHGYFTHLATGDIKEKITPNSYVQKTIQEDKWVSGKCSREQKEQIDGIKPHLTKHFQAIQDMVGDGLQRYVCQHAVLENIFPMAVLNEVKKMVDEIQEEDMILHISDFNKRIAAVIVDQPVPFIYERLGERYRHFMIDEFQDTSLLQWQNMLPLVENALSSGHMSLVVGDGKQAIYRFRNGDVAQFAKLPYLTDNLRELAKPEWENTLVNNYHEEALDTNWRSEQAIVTFNNRFFSFAAGTLADELQPIYDKVSQEYREDKPGGYVDIQFPEGKNNQELFTETMDRILSIIHDCRAAGHPCSDLTILCFKNDEASAVARELISRQIPVISQESLLLSHAKEVNFFLAILKLLTNPHDYIAAIEMIAFLREKELITKPATLHECLLNTGIYAAHKQHEDKPVTKAVEEILKENGFLFSFQDFVHQNIYDTCETILRRFFSEETPPNPFVAFFMDVVYDFSEKQLASYTDFLAWWEENNYKYSLVLPEGAGAVNVMTIHKSKGLQFPVVIYPFARQKPNKPTKNGLWADGTFVEVPELPATWLQMQKKSLAGTPAEPFLEEEQEKTYLDMLNACYVALTRASQKLFVISKKEPKAYKEQTINGLLYHFLNNEGIWDETQDTFTFGQFDSPPGKEERQESFENPLKQLLSSSWSHALHMRSHQKERSIIPDTEDALERGNLMHRALENIRFKEDTDDVLQRLVEQGEINSQQKMEWAEKIKNMLSQPAIAPCFEPDAQIKREAGLFDKEGHFYRPDRVVLLKDQTIIIDYKTGKQYEKHRKQMDAYAAILQDMGYPNVQKVLLYLDEEEAKTV